MNRKSIIQITDTLTGEAIQERLGVTAHSIRYARTTGVFPASWYEQVKAMCDETGIPCPLTAFNWKPQANKVSSEAPVFQEASK